jgi:hypothetical protein
MVMAKGSAPTTQSGAPHCMFFILKIEPKFTKEIDALSYKADMLVASNYQPHIDYLSKIDRDYWWHADRARALSFATRKEAKAAIAAYRKHQGDLRSLIKIVEV